MSEERPWWYDSVRAVSWANLCLLRLWVDLLSVDRFYTPGAPLLEQYVAAGINILLLSAFGFGVFRLVRRLREAKHAVAASAVVYIMAALPLNSLRSIASIYTPLLRSGLLERLGTTLTILLYAATAILAIALLIWMRNKALKAASLFLLCAAPLIPVIAFQAVSHALRNVPPAVPPLAPFAPAPPAHRVVWIIFDELDYRLAFVNRFQGLELPEFDRLRREGIFATDATSPASNTLPAIPALLRGRILKGSSTDSTGALWTTDRDSAAPERWTGESTIFATTKRMGVNSAVAAWYLPYCSLLGADLNRCFAMPGEHPLNIMGSDVSHLVPNQLRNLFETSLFSPFGQSLMTRRRAEVVQALSVQANAMVTDSRLGLVFIHIPVPHTPHSYNRFTHSFTLANSVFSGYPHSLALADRLVGEWRQTMTAAGLWDRTNLVVSSDHPYRDAYRIDGKSDHRVPFIVKLAGQKTGLEFTKPIETVATRSMVEALLRGEISEPAQLAAWLERVNSPGHQTW